jgi:hypothetical protein
MTQSNNPQDAEHTAEWYADFAEKQMQELLDMEAKMGSGMRKMKKRGMDLMGEDMEMDEEAIEPTEEELVEEEDEEVMEPTEEELSAPRRPMRKGYGMPMKPMREKGMNNPMPKGPMMPRAARPMPKGPMMKKKPMGNAEMSPVKPLTRDELMEKLFGKPKTGGNSPKAPNPSQGKGKK